MLQWRTETPRGGECETSGVWSADTNEGENKSHAQRPCRESNTCSVQRSRRQVTHTVIRDLNIARPKTPASVEAKGAISV